MRLFLIALLGCATAPPRPLQSTATSGTRATPEPPPEPDGDPTSPLQITGLEPATGELGTYVVINGAHFIKDGPRMAKVQFGDRPAQVIRFQSDGELIVQAPAGKDGEEVDVVVLFEPGGKRRLRKAFRFVVPAPPPP
jgi:hypothetical protein